LKNGFIKPLNKHSKPMIYRATSLTPVMVESPTPVMVDKYHWVCSVPHETKVNENEYDWRIESKIEVEEKDIEVHHLCYKFPVMGKPKRDVKWDKINTKMKGITQKYIYWKGRNNVSTTIRYDEYKNKSDQVVIWLPSTLIPAGQHNNAEKILDDYAYKAVAWLQKVMLCRLGLPELYRRPHYTVPVREPEIRSAIENNMTFKNGEVWMDNSEPKIGPCFESEVFEKTKCYSEMPDRLLRAESFLEKFTKKFNELDIEHRFDVLEKTVYSVLMAVEQITENQRYLAKGQEKLIESQLSLQKLILDDRGSKNQKDDERASDADKTMFG
jgi:hypothetical protein